MILATYNIHRCIGGDGRLTPESNVEVMKEIDADVIALQEVESRATAGFDMLGHLASAMGMHSIAGPTLVRGEGHYGNALLTRLDILDRRSIDISVPGCEPSGAIEARLRCDGREFCVVATLLGLRPSERRRQVQQLLNRFRPDLQGPAALLGDINEWYLWGRPLRWLHIYFKSTNAPRTFPARWPVFALDRCWIRPRAALARLEAHVSPAAHIASDHLPVMAHILTDALGDAPLGLLPTPRHCSYRRILCTSPPRETAIQTPADRLTYAAATPAALSTISLHDDVEAPPPFYQDSAARRLRRLARIPVVDRCMAGLVGGAQSREHRLHGSAPIRLARKKSTRRVAAALATIRAVHATRRLRLGRHASGVRKELAARPHRRGRLDHQPATRQKSLSLRPPQYLAQGGRGLHHRADGTDVGQAAHPRDLSQRRRVGRRRVRRRSRGKTLLRRRRVGIERRASCAARRHAAQPALLRPPSPDALSQPPHRRDPRAYAGRRNSALTYMRREWRNAAIRSRAPHRRRRAAPRPSWPTPARCTHR